MLCILSQLVQGDDGVIIEHRPKLGRKSQRSVRDLSQISTKHSASIRRVLAVGGDTFFAIMIR
jgi:hypothetical protein